MRALLVTLCVLAALSPCRAQSSLAPPARFADADRLAALRTAFPEVDRLMAEFAERERVPGIAYGVVVDGRLAHVGTAGVRDVATGAPVDTATVFRIASMTKSVTALAVLHLRDAGLLSLDDPAERYVPELAALRYPTADSPRVTIRHLLTHSAGFPEDNPWADQNLALSDDELSDLMRGGIPFSTAPGTAFEYSNFGYGILGRIVADVSGVPYADYVGEHILRPLGLTATVLEADAVPAGQIARGYRVRDGEWLEEAPLPDGAFGAMGGMWMTVGDLGRWVGLMLDAWPAGAASGPVRSASLREMQQVHRYILARATANPAGAPDLLAVGYGYGLVVRQTCRWAAVVDHSGGLPGYGSIMRWLPEHGVGVVALGNRTYTGWSDVTYAALDALAQTGALEPRRPQPSPVLALRQRQVTRLVTGWDDALADSLAAMNLFLDEPAERRRRAIEAAVAEAGGACRADGPLQAENALRGRWRMRCRDGDLRVSVTLAPTEPARVQALDVAPLDRDETLEPAPACR